MSNSFFHRNGYLLIHLLVLLSLLLLQCQPLAWNIKLPMGFWLMNGIMFCLWVSLYFLNLKLLVPRLLFQNHVRWFAIVTIGAVLVVMFLSLVIGYWLHLPELIHKAFNPNEVAPPKRPFFHFNPMFLLTTLLVLGTSTTIKVVQKWQEDTAIRQSLERQKISTELSFLRAQINPHFFFNTLHSIYALTMINIEAAREALHTLSRMMRYVLYETQSGTTMLSKEIEFMEDYIRLMKLRLTDKVTVVFNTPTPLRDAPVAPMLFLPFVENAFKHGISTLLPSTILINLSQVEQKLQLEVRNTILPEKRVVLEESSGIGLINTRRRLDLLYPGHYTLAITDKTPENEYRIFLTLDLTS